MPYMRALALNVRDKMISKDVLLCLYVKSVPDNKGLISLQGPSLEAFRLKPTR